MMRSWAYNCCGVLMGTSWRASCPRWLSLRGDSLPMITLLPSQGDFCATARTQKIAAAARWLNELRDNWLSPPDLIRQVPEVVPGYPDRSLPMDDKAAAILKKRT